MRHRFLQIVLTTTCALFTLLLAASAGLAQDSIAPPDPPIEVGNPFADWVNVSSTISEEPYIVPYNEQLFIYGDDGWTEVPYPEILASNRGFLDSPYLDRMDDGRYLITRGCGGMTIPPTGAHCDQTIDGGWIFDPATQTFERPTPVCINYVPEIVGLGQWLTVETDEGVHFCHTRSGVMSPPMPGIDKYVNHLEAGNLFSPDDEWFIEIADTPRGETDTYGNLPREDRYFPLVAHHVQTGESFTLGRLDDGNVRCPTVTHLDGSMDVSIEWRSNTEFMILASVPENVECMDWTHLYGLGWLYVGDVTEPDSLQPLAFRQFGLSRDGDVFYWVTQTGSDLMQGSYGVSTEKPCTLHEYNWITHEMQTYQYPGVCEPGITIPDSGGDRLMRAFDGPCNDTNVSLVRFDSEDKSITPVFDAQVQGVLSVSPEGRYAVVGTKEGREIYSARGVFTEGTYPLSPCDFRSGRPTELFDLEQGTRQVIPETPMLREISPGAIDYLWLDDYLIYSGYGYPPENLDHRVQEIVALNLQTGEQRLLLSGWNVSEYGRLELEALPGNQLSVHPQWRSVLNLWTVTLPPA